MLQIGAEEAWLWVAIESIHKQIGDYDTGIWYLLFLRYDIPKIVNQDLLFIAMEEHVYPESCISLGLERTTTSPYEKNI